MQNNEAGVGDKVAVLQLFGDGEHKLTAGVDMSAILNVAPIGQGPSQQPRSLAKHATVDKENSHNTTGCYAQVPIAS